MHRQFFIRDNGRQTGPFTIDQLREKNITSDTYVWAEGMKEWERARKAVPELFGEIEPPPFRGETDIVPPNRPLILVLILAVGLIFILTIFMYRKKDIATNSSAGTENVNGPDEKKNCRQIQLV